MNKHTQIRLTEFAKSAGCAAKLGQADLKDALSQLPKNLDKNLTLNIENSIPFKIRRYRVIRRTFTKVKPGTLLRIMIWNAKNQPIVDEAYPIVE